MKQIELVPGKEYLYQGNVIKINLVIDLQNILGEYIATGAKVKVPISSLQPYQEHEIEVENLANSPKEDILSITDENWKKAQERLAIIRPILENRGNLDLIDEIASDNHLSRATIYRWISQYDQFGSVVGLADRERSGGRGKPRTNPDVELIIDKAISELYLNRQRRSVAKVILEIQKQCLLIGIKSPGSNTIRRRIQNIPLSEAVKQRFGPKIAKENFSPIKGEFPGADYPLSVVQIDHTLVDIILVDEVYRKVVGRPWLTVAVDVFSRMVLGFYISFDPPGAVGTGLCISHTILPKELWLSKLNIQGEWSCWGVMRTIHLDNAREFKGKMLKKACEKYGINIEWRPVATPNWGGHIERLMGTFMKEVHDLTGTTFSNPKERKGYDSEKKAALTLSELEKWLTEFIVNVYHKRIHSGIKKSPQDRYKEGVFGSPEQPGTGLPKRLLEQQQVRLDFMPLEERTIQEYGVVIDHIYYYDDVLRKFINNIDVASGKSKVKRKFVFKRDPRDISCIYFMDPETKQYHRIPYRDTSRPTMSLWEHREIIKRLRDAGRENIDEKAIFEGYENMRRIEMEAVTTTKKISKNQNRILHGANTNIFYQNGEKITNILHQANDREQDADNERTLTKKHILPFDGLDDD